MKSLMNTVIPASGSRSAGGPVISPAGRTFEPRFPNTLVPPQPDNRHGLFSKNNCYHEKRQETTGLGAWLPIEPAGA
jgi:hypothetical protein